MMQIINNYVQLGADVTKLPAPTEAPMNFRKKPLSPVATPSTDLLIRGAPVTPVRNHRSDNGRPQIVIPESLRPFPRVSLVSALGGSKRTQGQTRILTATPKKNAIEESEKQKAPKSSAGQSRGKRKLAMWTTVNDENVLPQEDNDDYII
jgi:hypothetical protein